MYLKINKNDMLKISISCLLLSSLLNGYRVAFGYGIKYPLILLISFAVFNISYLILKNKWILLWTTVLVCIGALINFIVLFATNNLSVIGSNLYDYYYEAYASVVGADYLSISLQIFLIILIGFILSIIIYFFWFKKEYIYILIMFCIGFECVMFLIYPFGPKGKANFVFFLGIMMGMYLISQILNHKKILKLNNYGVVVITVLIFSCVSIFLSVNLYNYSEYLFGNINTIGKSTNSSKSVSSTDIETDTKSETDISSSGYEYNIEDKYSNYTSKPEYQGSEVMVVKTNKDKVYLKTATFNLLEDGVWKQNISIFLKNYITPLNIIDSNELSVDDLLISNVRMNKEGIEIYEDLNNIKIDGYGVNSSVQILLKDINTKVFPTPQNPKRLIIVDDQDLDIDISATMYGESEVFYYDNGLQSNLMYTVDFYDIDYRNEDIIEILRNSQENYNKWLFGDNDILIDEYYNEYYIFEGFVDEDKYIYVDREVIQNYNLVIDDYEYYLLAEEITKEYNNNYDKAIAIETYLKENYKYNDDPEHNSEDRLYEFLFETKEGLCKDYATAMVIMLRSIGIPARYVTGFVTSDPVLDRSDEEQAKEKNYIIKDEDAHAWVEVYFQGFGWVPFEPTSGYYNEVDLIASVESKETEAENFDYKIIYYFLSGIFLVLVLLYIYTYTGIVIRYKLKRKENKEKYKVYYTYCYKLLLIMNLKRNKNETLREFINKCEKIVDFEEINFKALTEKYEEVYYGKEEINDSDVDEIISCYKVLKKKAGKLGKRFKYRWYLITYKIL